MNRWWILTCCLLAAPVAAERVDLGDLSLTLPTGWIEIPREVLDAVQDTMRGRMPGVEVPDYEYGFQPESEQWMTYPYLLVDILEDQRIPEPQLERLARHDFAALARKVASETSGFIEQIDPGQPVYDPERRLIWLMNSTRVEGVGEVRNLSVTVPTETGIISLHAYDQAGRFEGSLPTLQGILDSVAIRPDLAYQPRWSDDLPAALAAIDWSDVANAAIIGGILGALFALITMVWGRLKSRGERERGAGQR